MNPFCYGFSISEFFIRFIFYLVFFSSSVLFVCFYVPRNCSWVLISLTSWKLLNVFLSSSQLKRPLTKFTSWLAFASIYPFNVPGTEDTLNNILHTTQPKPLLLWSLQFIVSSKIGKCMNFIFIREEKQGDRIMFVPPLRVMIR